MLLFQRLFSNMYLFLPLKPKHLLRRVFQSLLLGSNRWRLFVVTFPYFGLLVSQIDLFDSVFEIKNILVAVFIVPFNVVRCLGIDSWPARQRLWSADDLLLWDFVVYFLDAHGLVHVEIEPHFIGGLLSVMILSSRRPGLVANLRVIVFIVFVSNIFLVNFIFAIIEFCGIV